MAKKSSSKKSADRQFGKAITNLNIVKDFLTNVGGKYAVNLVKICHSQKNRVKDELLADRLKLKVTEVRTVLNRLHYRGIAEYDKKRDSKSGWYSYTWNINNKRIAELIMEEQMETIEKLEQKQAFEKDYSFFSCREKCDSFPFEVAAEYRFKCPQCGETMNAMDGQKRDAEASSRVKVLKSEISVLKKLV